MESVTPRLSVLFNRVDLFIFVFILFLFLVLFGNILFYRCLCFIAFWERLRDIWDEGQNGLFTWLDIFLILEIEIEKKRKREFMRDWEIEKRKREEKRKKIKEEEILQIKAWTSINRVRVRSSDYISIVYVYVCVYLDCFGCLYHIFN